MLRIVEIDFLLLLQWYSFSFGEDAEKKRTLVVSDMEEQTLNEPLGVCRVSCELFQSRQGNFINTFKGALNHFVRFTPLPLRKSVYHLYKKIELSNFSPRLTYLRASLTIFPFLGKAGESMFRN